MPQPTTKNGFQYERYRNEKSYDRLWYNIYIVKSNSNNKTTRFPKSKGVATKSK